MTRIRIKKLVWDDWNTEHIKKHNVTIQEVESVAQKIITHQRVKNGRYALSGRVRKRILTVIVHREEQGIYYVVTARDGAKKERKKVYEKEKK